MEFLFTNQIASIEAFVVFLCIAILASLFIYEGFFYIRSIFFVFFPQKKSIPSRETNNIESNTVSTESIIESLGQTESVAPTLSTVNTTEELVLDNPILYPEEPLLTASVPGDSDINPAPDTIHLAEGEKSPSEMVQPVEYSNDSTSIDVERKIEKTENLESVISAFTAHKVIEELLPEKEVKSSKKSSKKEKLSEIINAIKTLIARGQLDEARALIVSGLAIDKDHRELNLLMAGLYERDHAFSKAEFILKDIAMNYPEDIEVLTHLATDLAMQRKYEVSYELYKKILSLGQENEETLYTLTHLASEMGLSDDVILYARAYLKQYPHNPEVLWLYAESLIATGGRKEAIEVLIKLKNLTPYNEEITDLIQKLVTEEELAGNFGGEK